MEPIIVTVNGKTPRIHPSAWIAPGCVIAGDVEIGPEVGVWYGAVIRTEHVPVIIGARSSIQDNAVVHTSPYMGLDTITIGEEVTVGHGAILHHCCVGNRSLVGMGSIILDGASLEDDVVVAAGTLIGMRTRVPSRSLIIGNPGKIRRDATDEELASFARGMRLYVGFRDFYKNPAATRAFNPDI